MPRLGGRGLWLGLAAAAVAAMIARLTGWWSPRADFRLFIPEELARYRGRPGDPGLYLALLGRVYDVSSGRRHYEPGAPYSGFAGISRAAPAVSCYDAGGLPTAFHSFTHSFVPSFIHLLFFFPTHICQTSLGAVLRYIIVLVCFDSGRTVGTCYLPLSCLPTALRDLG